jgi:dolichol-phosphate mannosyltransferase
MSECVNTLHAREVPRFVCTCFGPKSSTYCACVFVINENGRLREQLEKMQPLAGLVDIVIADGGSMDGSTARHILEPLGVNTLLVKVDEGKLGTQMRMAFAWALDRGYEGVVTLDGNNKDDPQAVPAFVEGLRGGYDYIQGSRFLPGGISENLPLSRRLGIRLIHAPLVSLSARFRYTDTTNGFRAYSARFLADPRTALFRRLFTGYELHYYLAVRAVRLGFRVTEIPVSRRYPHSGPVITKISPVRGNLTILRSLVDVCLGRYDPQ